MVCYKELRARGQDMQSFAGHVDGCLRLLPQCKMLSGPSGARSSLIPSLRVEQALART